MSLTQTICSWSVLWAAFARLSNLQYQFLRTLRLYEVQAPTTRLTLVFVYQGDFVDRGFYSVETFLLLLALKVSSHCLYL